MRRWLGILIAICLVSPAVDAQVFKPRSKKAATSSKKAAADPEAQAAKKQPRAAPAKKRPGKKKSSASERTTSDEETAEPSPKKAGKDYVNIWDDEEIE